MSKLSFIILGTTQLALDYADSLLQCGAAILGIVCLPQHALPLNSVDVAGYCRDKGIKYKEFLNINEGIAVEWIKTQRPDYILSAWPHILKGEIFNIAPGGIIGSHPTDLPYNRGRHPLHWLIALGIRHSKMSFFLMDAGVDSGVILHQEPFEVGQSHIAELVARMNAAASHGLRNLYTMMAAGDVLGKQQNHSKANYWRKRSKHDSYIDPRLSRSAIDRIVRSFSSPYPCALLRIEDHEYPICECQQVDNMSVDLVSRMEPGKIVDLEGNKLTLKVDDGLICLVCSEDFNFSIASTKYIHPPSYYISCVS